MGIQARVWFQGTLRGHMRFWSHDAMQAVFKKVEARKEYCHSREKDQRANSELLRRDPLVHW
jgi:hypothetical protein